jgi:hypothetical protein
MAMIMAKSARTIKVMAFVSAYKRRSELSRIVYCMIEWATWPMTR